MATWQVAMAAEDLWAGEMTGVELGGMRVVLLNVAGEIRAFEDRCPHLGSRLTEGDLQDATLVCASHLWEFDALSGNGINPGNCRLTAIGTRVREGRIELLMPVPGNIG
ncbi:Rieske 2Fe-2S domain-containing protein [Streptomyces sp. NPDC050704]|uniref:Rieske (2Fe-2S) protein n=1 Tax=Streptomyces sp. NPDC050704 TaxID=3157219 RepID=UPI0034360FF6